MKIKGGGKDGDCILSVRRDIIENIMKGCEPYVSDHFVDGRLYFWKFSHG